MLRIGILEDEKARSDELMGFLERYKNEHGSFSYSVKVYETGGKLLFDYKQDYIHKNACTCSGDPCGTGVLYFYWCHGGLGVLIQKV
jgi:hypothetical protein